VSDASDQVSDQARFAAREFLARWTRETGEVPSAVVTDRMLFTYEIGYLRGRSDGSRSASQMFDGLSQARAIGTEEEKDDDDATE
jgi:hypothetical protein